MCVSHHLSRCNDNTQIQTHSKKPSKIRFFIDMWAFENRFIIQMNVLHCIVMIRMDRDINTRIHFVWHTHTVLIAAKLYLHSQVIAVLLLLPLFSGYSSIYATLYVLFCRPLLLCMQKKSKTYFNKPCISDCRHVFFLACFRRRILCWWFHCCWIFLLLFSLPFC